MKKILLLLILLNISFVLLNAQTNKDESRSGAVKVYLVCNGCDLQYIKDEINYVSYVRDPREADVTVLKTSQNAGNGGKKYTLIFEGRHKFLNRNDTLEFSTMPDATADDIRKLTVKYLKTGLMYYVAHSPQIDDISINYTKKLKAEVKEDKWKNWVAKLSSSAFVNGESSYRQTYVNSSINVYKITEDWKINFKVENSFIESMFILPYDTILSITRSNSFRTKIVKSLGEHWSIGEISNIGNSSYANEKFYAVFKPTIEYNFLPYSKSNISQFIIQYSIGPVYNIYYDTTIYNQTEELLFRQRFGAAYRINKTWGYINAWGTYQSYLHDFSKNSFSVGLMVNLRLFKGFSVYASGNYYIIHDQISLPKGNLSYEEILLRQQEIATDYTFWSSLGISYTFGSIYNNIVNPRIDDF